LVLARDDLLAGLRKSWMWTALATQDIRLRYRGSMLGPFWLTISTIVMIAAMGFIYARLFKMDLSSYLPYLTIGLVVWQFISTVVNEGCNTFLNAQTIIQQVRLPLSVHVYRMVCRNIIVLAHSFVIVPVVLVLFGVSMNATILLLVPGFVLLVLNCVWVGILLGIISARFRDVPPIVANFLQIAFFVTPIFWVSDALENERWKLAAELNPLFAAIDVVRSPLLGQTPAPTSWFVLILTTIAGCWGTFVFFAHFRRRLAYWI
jgi:ABC-2 type transport system permease protein/lipopolysaccharide transport system permease protein